MSKKTDLREYSDSELSLVVFNNEYLYTLRHSILLDKILEDLYLYTPEQKDELNQDIYDDLEEMEKV